MENNAMPATLRRRRRKKNVPQPRSTISSIPSSDINRQDAELEREVDSYLNWGREHHTQKRKRRAYGGNDASTRAAHANVNTRGNVSETAKDISRVLPMLLHLREVGLSRRLINKNCRRSWKSLMMHQTASASSTRKEGGGSVNGRYSNLARLRVPVHPTSASSPNSRWNALQYSSPTYYGIVNNTNNSTRVEPNQSSADLNKQNDDMRFGSNIQLHRQSWRSYTQQSIPFSKLQTPLSDAILAVDRWGGYLIGVGSGAISDCNTPEGMCPHLAIKFYGVPSPARLQQIESQDSNRNCAKIHTVCPLVHSVPLLFKHSSSVENRNFPAPSSILGHNEYASPAAETPIQILLSDSGTLGVALLHHSTAAAWSNDNASTFSESPALQDEDILGTIVIFEPPRVASGYDASQLTKSFRCSNVRIGGWSSMRNALWPTTLIPTKINGMHMDTKENVFNSSPVLCHYFHKALSAYVLFNDEDDGFRITWITIVSVDDENEEVTCAMNARSSFGCPTAIRPARTDIVVQSEGNIWDVCLSDRETGHCCSDISSQAENCSGLDISYEVYLHVDALLSDIISRRQSSLFKKSPYHNGSVFFMPDFFYNLISASPDDLKVVLVIVFSNKEKMMHSSAEKVPSALGVFVEFNLFDQSYDELKWVQHPSCNDASSMKRWCTSLSLNWRMKECSVGVFCLDNSKIGPQFDQWVGGTHECNVDEDLRDDYNVDLWSNYVDRRNTSERKGVVAAPKDISMSSLYPYCDTITNRAVHNAIPVKRMASRNSPIELIYG